MSASVNIPEEQFLLHSGEIDIRRSRVSVKWWKAQVLHKALFYPVTDDDVLELDHIREYKISGRESYYRRNDEPPLDEIPEFILASMRGKGLKPADVGSLEEVSP